jgi:hypothetical protein
MSYAEGERNNTEVDSHDDHMGNGLQHDSSNNNDDHPKPQDLSAGSQAGGHLPSISTMYTRLSAKLIRSAETSTTVIIIAIVALAAMSLIDTFEVETLAKVFPRDTLDMFITVFSFGVLGAMIYVLRSLLRTRKTLERWADTFEQNAIKNSLNIALTGLDKQEVMRAISESIEQLADPLESYIVASSLTPSAAGPAGPLEEFFDVKVDDIAPTFDILIDEDRIKPERDRSGEKSLKRLLREYGSIIAKIVDGTIGADTVHSFSDSLHLYSKKTGRDIGLAVIVCKKAKPEAWRVAASMTPAQALKKQSQRIILVESSSDQDIDFQEGEGNQKRADESA